jgi:hypothetical protein
MLARRPNRRIARRHIAVEIVLAAGLIAGAVAILSYAYHDFRTGRSAFEVTELVGAAIFIFGGCFDPFNTVALFLPWVFDDVAQPTPLSRLRWPFFGLDFALGIVGVVGKHWTA